MLFQKQGHLKNDMRIGIYVTGGANCHGYSTIVDMLEELNDNNISFNIAMMLYSNGGEYTVTDYK